MPTAPPPPQPPPSTTGLRSTNVTWEELYTYTLIL